MHKVTMYTTPWCGYCRRLKRQMLEEGIDFEEIDVDATPGYDARIISASGGYRTVPTLEIDGRLFVNPTITVVKEAVSGSAA